MKVAITGASGLVGRGFVADAQVRGDQVVALTRPDFDLAGPVPRLNGVDLLIHAGFAHVPGRYRGGEGDDPEGFVKINRDGSIRLFEQAARDGVGAIAFVSTRAVYGRAARGEPLLETRKPDPDTLYGQVKYEAEQALSRLDIPSVSLRSTGVYGPGPGHKWEQLFTKYLGGKHIDARVGTEVHVADLANAARIALNGGAPMVNVSDIIVDRADLLSAVAKIAPCDHRPPPHADAQSLNVADCTRLNDLGWVPCGWAGLRQALPEMLLRCGS